MCCAAVCGHYQGVDFEEQFRDIAARLGDEMSVGPWNSKVFVLNGEKVSVRLPEEVRLLIAKIFGDLAEVLEERDPVTDVLFKNPYEDHDSMLAWDLLAGESLRTERTARARSAAAQAAEGIMSPEDIQNWLRVTNDVRIILCGEDPSEERVEELSCGSEANCVVYQLMTALLAELTTVW